VSEAPVEELRPDVRDAASTPIDETSWEQGRGRAWLRAAVTRLVTVVAIAPSRGAGVAEDVLGTDRREVVISDRFRGSGRIERRRCCGAPRGRDLQALIDRGGESAEVGQRWLGHSGRLFDWWHRVRDGTTARAALRRRVGLLRFWFRADRRRGVGCGRATTAATCRELLAGEAPLRTFVRVGGSSRRTTPPSGRCGTG
jgi:transposase